MTLSVLNCNVMSNNFGSAVALKQHNRIATLPALTALPDSSLLWGLWPMDTLTGGAVADFAPSKGVAQGPPNNAALGGSSSVLTTGRAFAPGTAFFIGTPTGAGASSAHPMDPAYWGGSHDLTFACNVRLNSGRDDDIVLVMSTGGTNQSNYFLQVDFSTGVIRASNEDSFQTFVNYDFHVSVDPSKFDDQYHSIVFVRAGPVTNFGFSNSSIYLDGVLLGTNSSQNTNDNNQVHAWNGTTGRTEFPGYFNGTQFNYTAEMRDVAVWKAVFTSDQVETMHQLCLTNRRLKTFLGL